MTTQKTSLPEIIPNDKGKVPFIGKNCAMFREMNKWNQDQLGEKLHVSQQAVSKYENSKELPLEIVQNIAKIFEVNIYYLTQAEESEMKSVYQSNTYDNGQNTNVLWSDNIHVYPTNDVKEGFAGQVEILKDQLEKKEQEYKEQVEENIQLRLKIQQLEMKA